MFEYMPIVVTCGFDRAYAMRSTMCLSTSGSPTVGVRPSSPPPISSNSSMSFRNSSGAITAVRRCWYWYAQKVQSALQMLVVSIDRVFIDPSRKASTRLRWTANSTCASRLRASHFSFALTRRHGTMTRLTLTAPTWSMPSCNNATP